jgi:hypothetical protein
MKKFLALLGLCLAAAAAGAQTSRVAPAPDENLYDYRKRMEAYFAQRTVDRAAEGGEYNEYVRFLRLWEARLFPHGDFKEYFRQEALQYEPPVRRRVARHDGEEQAQDPLPNLAPWREIGPRAKPSGKGGAGGTGPTEFLVFGPQPERMLCGSTAGGLFYSKDGGATWSSTGTDTEIHRSGVGSAVFHPSQPGVWFASSSGNHTTEQFFIGISGGIFRTVDEGVNWTRMAKADQVGGMWSRIFKLVIDPSGNHLWAATSAGLYETSSLFATEPSWDPVLPLKGEYVYDLELQPDDPSRMYATVGTWSKDGKSRENWRVMTSPDGGKTWQPLANLPPAMAAARSVTLEVTPAKRGNVYVLTTGQDAVSQLHVHDRTTGVWTLVASDAMTNHGHGHAFGVDPSDPNEIFLSHDTHGRRYNIGGSDSPYQFNNTYDSNGTYHPDIEDLIPHPVNPNEVWMCHHGGVSVSFDNGNTWQDRSNGLGTAQVQRMAAASEDPSYVAAGLYHAATILTATPWTQEWSPDWRLLTEVTCDGMRPLLTPSGQYQWHSCQVGWWFRSEDYGQSFTWNGPPYSPEWIADGVLSRINPGTQYRVSQDFSGTSVARSMDWGINWQNIVDFNAFFPPSLYEYAVWRAYLPQTACDYLVVHVLSKPRGFAYWTNHHLFRTKIANAPFALVRASWHELPLPVNMWLADVEFDPSNPDVLFLANGTSTPNADLRTGKDIVYRVDYTNPLLSATYACKSAVCRELTQNLPNTSTGEDGLAIDVDDPGSLYLATDYGVYYSNEATRGLGAGWTKFGTRLPHALAMGIEIHNGTRKIRAATWGRGVWEHDLAGAIEGHKFNDVNRSGFRDPGEPGLGGITIRLTGVGTGASTDAVTGDDGRYVFSALDAGHYVVSEPAQLHWIQTYPPEGQYAVSLAGAERRTGLDFGNRVVPNTCTLVPQDMVAWWTFDGTLAGTASDRALTDNTGTLRGGASGGAGKVRGALALSGDHQAVEVPSHADLQPGTGDFTIEAWVRTTAHGVQSIVDKRSAAGRGYAFFLLNGRAGLTMGDRAGSPVCSTSNATSACTSFIAPQFSANVADGTWHHVAVTVDRDARDGGRLWVDGAIVLEFDPTIRNQSLDVADPLWMGLRVATPPVAGAAYFAGELDEVAIYRRALSAYEVQAAAQADTYGRCKCSGCPEV